MPSISRISLCLAVEIVSKLRVEFRRVKIVVADNIVVTPVPQDKRYSPCPSVFSKMTVGADGWLYACTDHRGCAARVLFTSDNTAGMWKERGDP